MSWYTICMNEGPDTNHKRKNSAEAISSEHTEFEVFVEKYEKVARFAALAGAIAVTGYVAKEVSAEYDAVLEHEAYVTSVLSVEEFAEYNTLKSTLEEKYGELVLERLVAGDRAAFKERGSERPDTTFEGFENDSALGDIVNIDYYPDFTFTESFGLYPEGWINGEITKVIVKDGNEAPREDGNVHNGYHNPVNSFIIIYNVSDRFSESTQFSVSSFHEYMEHTFAHEAAHANDWETKQGLNILERTQFLQKVTNRMSSDTAYSAQSLADGSDYWRSYDDGTEKGFRRMAKEYWAEICAAYFTNPRSFKTKSPEDFALVQEMVAKTDSDFDILDPERGAYSQMTGLPNEKWLLDIQKLKDQ